MSISDWTNGNVQPNAESIFLLAKYFGVSSDFLLGLEDDFGNRVQASSPAISQEDAELLNKYHSLDYNSKKLLDQMLDRLLPTSADVKRKNFI